MNKFRSGRMAGWLLLAVLFSIGLCGGWFSEPASAADSPAVTLKGRVKISFPPLMLSDIIAEKNLPVGLSDIFLGEIPAVGKGKFINRSDVIIAARKQGKTVPEFLGPNMRSHIVRPDRKVLESEIKPRVQKLLEEHFTDRDNINIEIKRVPRQVSMLPGEYQLQFARRDPYHRLHGSDWYEVEVLQKGKSTASFRVRADVTQFVKVPTARNMIMNGDVIRAEDIVWEERESSSIYGGVITDTKSILGFETKRSFRAGQVIQKRSLERPLAVKRNKPVTIKYSFNGINVNAHGIAQGSGAIGEKIVVENSSSDERVYAEIIDKRTVQVINENN